MYVCMYIKSSLYRHMYMSLYYISRHFCVREVAKWMVPMDGPNPGLTWFD